MSAVAKFFLKAPLKEDVWLVSTTQSEVLRVSKQKRLLLQNIIIYY